MTSKPQASIRRRLAAIAATAALLLGACGGGDDDAELSTIDAELPGAVDDTDAASPDTPDDEPLELDTVETPDDEGDQLPEAVLPPAPAPESSPAERQRLQELGLAEAPAAPVERLPIPDEDLDDASNPANARPTPEPPRELENPDLYPDTIPAIVPGAPDPRNPSDDLFAVPEQPAPPALFGNVDPEGSLNDAGDPSLLGGGDAGLASGVAPPEEEAPVELSVPETVTDEFDDPLNDPDSFEPLDDGLPAPAANEPRESDCEARPWERGCDGPPPDRPSSDGTGADGAGGSGGDVIFDDDGDPVDPANDAYQDQGEGVDVPQDVIDILLTPGDNDRPEGDDDPSVPSADDADGGNDSDSETVNPAGG